MKGYKKKVYVSMSWKNSDFPLSKFVVEKFINNDLTVVGDHPEYQKDDPFERSWITRIHSLMEDCSGLVVILPSKENAQTTSPYMFPEILSASIHQIPILLFHHQGVHLKAKKTKIGINLHFGNESNRRELSTLDFLHHKKEIVEIDSELNTINSLKLQIGSFFKGPFVIPGNDDIGQICSDFIENQIKRVRGKFVFNIIPFSMRKREHVAIAKGVFKETGLPCHVALDFIGESQNMRNQWESQLKKCEFVIADLTRIRDACLFEVGVAMGLGKQVFILSSSKVKKLPYGLDNLPLITYESTDDLQALVQERCCGKYKRKVYNFEEDITGKTSGKAIALGIPEWFNTTTKPLNPLFLFTVCSWILSFSFAAIIWSLLVLFGAKDSPLGFVSMAISLVFGLSSSFREGKQYFESKLIGKLRPITIGTFITFTISIILLIWAYQVQN